MLDAGVKREAEPEEAEPEDAEQSLPSESAIEAAPEEADLAARVQMDLITMPNELPERKPADLLKLVEQWKSELVETHKIRHDRIVVLFTRAGEYEGNTLETWVVPAGALLLDPDAEPVEDAPEETEGSKEEGGAEHEKKIPLESSDTQLSSALRSKLPTSCFLSKIVWLVPRPGGTKCL